jgi:hypothetical protein
LRLSLLREGVKLLICLSVLSFLFLEEAFCVAFLCLCFGGLLLQVFHEFYLVGESFAPKLFPFIVFLLPVGEFLLYFLDIFSLCVVDPEVVLLLLLEQSSLSLGFQLCHLVL